MISYAQISVRLIVFFGSLSALIFYLGTGGFEFVWIDIKWNFFPLIALVSFIAWYVRVWRLKCIMIGNSANVTMLQCLQGRGVELLFNLFLPLRGGDLVRCSVLSKLVPGSSIAKQIGYNAYEKSVEITSLIVVFFFFTGFVSRPELEKLQDIAVVTAVTLFVGASLVTVFQRKLETFFKLQKDKTQCRICCKFYTTLIDFLSVFHGAGNRKTLILTILQSAVLRFMEGLILYLLLLSISAKFSFVDAIFLSVLIGLGCMIPTSPGSVGVYQAIVVFGLTIWDITGSIALNFALVSHLWLFFVWFVIIGITVLSLPRQLLCIKGLDHAKHRSIS